MEKQWVLQKADKPCSDRLYEQLKIRPVYCRLLASRGIRNFKEAKAFFRPAGDMLHDPFAMKDMHKAVERIEKAIREKEKVLLYGDYDVDGTTAIATVFSFLKTQYPGLPLGYYIPDRYKEGYGISKAGIDYAKTKQISLIIVLDCGIKALEQAKYAKSMGIDLVIGDHHLPGDRLPEAYAVLNPKQQGCDYPYKSLSGCGIGYKLISALAKKQDLPSYTTGQYLDLVATSIAADIVPVTGENRTLAYLGLKKMNKDPLPGLKALITISGLKKEIRMEDIVFMIAPRINAAGRLKDAALAVTLFIEKNVEAVSNIAKELHELNNKRKQLDKEITAEIIERINDEPHLKKRKTTVIFGSDWHKGVIGITASRLMETYYRPTIVLAEDKGKITGSARSVKGFNIYEALKTCRPFMERFGGHKYAAGLTLKPDVLETFSEKFEEVVAATINPEMLVPQNRIDAELTLPELTEGLYNMLLQFEPFGPKNEQPVFLLNKVKDNGYSRIIGGKHIRLEIIHSDFPGQSIAGIGFNLAKKFDIAGSGKLFDLCFCIEKNDFSGKSHLQLRVLDLRPSEIEGD